MRVAKGLVESTYIVPCYPLYPALAYALIYLAHPTSLLALPTHVCLLRAVTSLARSTCSAVPLIQIHVMSARQKRMQKPNISFVTHWLGF